MSYFKFDSEKQRIIESGVPIHDAGFVFSFTRDTGRKTIPFNTFDFTGAQSFRLDEHPEAGYKKGDVINHATPSSNQYINSYIYDKAEPVVVSGVGTTPSSLADLMNQFKGNHDLESERTQMHSHPINNINFGNPSVVWPGLDYAEYLYQNQDRIPQSLKKPQTDHYFFGSIILDENGDWSVPYMNFDIDNNIYFGLKPLYREDLRDVSVVYYLKPLVVPPSGEQGNPKPIEKWNVIYVHEGYPISDIISNIKRHNKPRYHLNFSSSFDQFDALFREIKMFRAVTNFGYSRNLTELPDGLVFMVYADFKGCSNLTAIGKVVFNDFVDFSFCKKLDIRAISKEAVFSRGVNFSNCINSHDRIIGK